MLLQKEGVEAESAALPENLQVRNVGRKKFNLFLALQGLHELWRPAAAVVLLQPYIILTDNISYFD